MLVLILQVVVKPYACKVGCCGQSEAKVSLVLSELCASRNVGQVMLCLSDVSGTRQTMKGAFCRWVCIVAMYEWSQTKTSNF